MAPVHIPPKLPEGEPPNVQAESIVKSIGTPCVGEAPHVSIEEITDPACSGHRGLRVVFVTPGLVANDTALEVGTQAVRLASLSGAWPELDVPLPFPVEPPG